MNKRTLLSVENDKINRIGTVTDGKRESQTSLLFSNLTLICGALKIGQVKP